MHRSSLQPSPLADFKSSVPAAQTKSPSLAWFAALLICLIGFAPAGFAQKAVSSAAAAPAVTLTDDGHNFILSNGYLTATINKISGDMVSLKVKGIETQGYVSGHHAGYWEQNPAGAARMESKVTIDPATNGGERAEVSVKGWSDGKGLNSGGGPRPGNEFAGIAPGALGSGTDAEAEGETPGAQQLPAGVARNRGTQTGRGPRPSGAAGPGGAGPGAPGGFGGGGGRGGMQLDMEIRYTLGRGEKGIYTYAIFTHEPTYGATQIGESRYGMKLNGGCSTGSPSTTQRNMAMPNGYDWDQGTDLNMKEARLLTTGVKKGIAEHKYDYCADQFDGAGVRLVEHHAAGWDLLHQPVGGVPVGRAGPLRTDRSP